MKTETNYYREKFSKAKEIIFQAGHILMKYADVEKKIHYKTLEKVLFAAHDIRRTGSAAIDICCVAMGRYEGYYEKSLQPWDMAAAVLVATEAGAMVSKLNDDRFDLNEGEILATNGKIHKDLIELLKGYGSEGKPITKF